MELDPKSLKLLENSKIKLIKRKNYLGNIYFDVCINKKFDINYERMAKKWVKSFNKKHKAKTKKQFEKWLYK